MARSRRTRSRLGLVALVAACAVLLPAAARGADRIYWANFQNDTIAFANLDGSGGGGILNTTGATVKSPFGLAVDTAAGRIYWSNDVADGSISYARLDGTGGGNLNTAGATTSLPEGLALDPSSRRIFWPNFDGQVSFARLDGTGGGDLMTSSGFSRSKGIAVDPAAGRLYTSGVPITFASLDGTAEGRIDATGATPAAAASPSGPAVDAAGGRVYWAGRGTAVGGVISYANLDGSGGKDLNTTGATVDRPFGVAVDHVGGRVYWANVTGAISYANLDGSGGGDLSTSGATTSGPGFPVLLRAPVAAAPPMISGRLQGASTVTCSPGTWAPDEVAALLYRAPHSFAFQWSRNGREIAGATGSSLATEPTGGDYRCEVTARNAAGSAVQVSAAGRVAPAAFARATGVTLALAGGRVGARGPVTVRVTNANAFPITGTLSAQTSKPLVAHGRRVKLHAVKMTLAAHAKRTVKLVLPRALRVALASRHKLSLALTATVKDPAGNRRTVKKTIAPRLPPAKRRR